MAVPTFVAAGDEASGTSISLTPGFPAGLQAGDLLLLQVSLHSATFVDGSPTGFNQAYSDLADSVRQDVWTKEAGGSESGTLTVTFNVSAYHVARIYALRGGTSLEGAAVSTFDDQTTLSHPALVTSGDDRLGVALLNSQQAQSGFPTFSGMSGGTWVERAESARLQLQTVDKATAGTVSGGSMTGLVETDSVVRVFAVSAGAAPPAGGAPNMMLLGVG